MSGNDAVPRELGEQRRIEADLREREILSPRRKLLLEEAQQQIAQTAELCEQTRHLIRASKRSLGHSNKLP
jgi:hypothetical protein